MANQVISTPLDLSELDLQQRVAPVEYRHWPARPGLARPGLARPELIRPGLDGSAGQLAESPACRSRAARGALLGILLGAATYGAGLILLGVIKL